MMRKTVSLVLLAAFVATIFAETEDPCLRKFCRHGKICLINKDNSTVCECPTGCPSEEHEPVCSVYGMEFQSRCELHKFACNYGIVMGVENQGKCVQGPKAVASCPIDQLVQFHDRYMEFIFVAREREANPDFKMGDKRIDSLTDVEKTDIILWEFKSRDLNKNNIIEPREIEMIMDPLLEVEHCVYGFLKSCDYNEDGNIEKREWESCFPPVLAAIEEMTDE